MNAPRSPRVCCRPLRPVGAGLGLALLCGALSAQEAPEPSWLPAQAAQLVVNSAATAEASPRPRATVEVDSRRAAPTGGALFPAAEPAQQLRMRYVHWADSGQQAALGVSVGVGVQRMGTPTALPASLMPAATTTMAPEVGVRWRSGWRGDRRVDVDAWRSFEAAPGQALRAEQSRYNARVELQFREAKSNLDLAKGALGFQMSSKSQISLRAKKGGPMVYYRSQW